MNRREFLSAGAAAGLAVTAFGPHVAGAADAKPVRAGLIGCGWYGKNDLFRLIQVATRVPVVNLCRMYSRMRPQASELLPAQLPSARDQAPRLYGDYRQMLKERDLDVVLVGTPDHWHALSMIGACEAGADVYCQKPISVDVREGEAMVAVARKYNRVVQIGMQRRSTPHLIDAIDGVIKAGKLGTIGHDEVCCYYHMRPTGNPPDTRPPEQFDYEMWTGPAPMRPYSSMTHPRSWRGFWEYGNGIVGDMCVHMFDAVRWMLGLRWPSRVSSSGGIYVERTGRANITDTQSATFDFDQPKMTVTWQHRTWGTSPDPVYPWGLFIYGDKGTLKASTERWDFVPAGRRDAAMSGKSVLEPDKYPEEKTERDFEPHAALANRQQMLDFLAQRTTCPPHVTYVEHGCIYGVSCILANVSMQVGRTITLDPATGRLNGDPSLEKLLARPYRGEWVHPGGAGDWTPWESDAATAKS
jgi:predicted dehydrogenase